VKIGKLTQCSYDVRIVRRTVGLIASRPEVVLERHKIDTCVKQGRIRNLDGHSQEATTNKNRERDLPLAVGGQIVVARTDLSAAIG
jgi:hypothetical protein